MYFKDGRREVTDYTIMTQLILKEQLVKAIFFISVSTLSLPKMGFEKSALKMMKTGIL